MEKNQILYKTIGFINYTRSEIKNLTKGLSEFKLNQEDTQFLSQSYHTEYLQIL